MEKSFCLGIALGMCAGLLVAANSYKVRKFVYEKQKTVTDGLEKIAEEKQEEQPQNKE